jgi:predicted lipoprotein with Yx(FWY)xxD motif
VSGTITDESGIASLSIDGTPVTIDGDGYYELTVNGLITGVNLITVEACDIYGNCITIERTITKLVCNLPPVADAGTDQSVHPATITVTLDGSGSYDPDQDPLTYSWQITSMPQDSSTELWDAETVNPTFVPDLMGDYTIELVVTDSLGAQSAPDSVLVSTYNTPPVADAGDDQALIELDTIVQLGGTQSWDDEGDPISYLWTITGKPAGSLAVLDDPSSATPTFVADVQGDYVISLTVTDIFDAASEPDTVAVSFENVKPVADAGGSQGVIAGETVFLDGSASHDENGDPLTYSWSFVSMPEGSLAELSDPTSVQTSFVADEVGTFVVSLVVNDGFVDSDPANVTIEVISCVDAGTQTLLDLIEVINNLPQESLKNRNMKTPLINKINTVLSKVENGLYEEAVDKLINDLAKKTNGCAEIGEPDRNDWLTTCEAQDQVYPLTMSAIAFLENCLGGLCVRLWRKSGQSGQRHWNEGGQYELLGGFWPGGPLCIVEFEDYAEFAQYWLQTGSGLPADLYEDDIVDDQRASKVPCGALEGPERPNGQTARPGSP